MPDDKYIKKIDISETDTPDEHELAAKYIQETSDKSTISGLKTWADILELLEAGFEAVKLTTLPTADATAYSTYHNCIVFIPKDPQPASGNDNCDEYIIQRTGTDPNYSYSWEHIGSTDVDLSGYVQKGTYTTEAASGNTGAGGATVITVSISNQDAVSKTATISYDKATGTGNAGANTNDNTGEDGGHIIQGSNFNFNGTGATLTPKTKIKKHVIAAHSHAVNAATESVTIVTGVKASGGTVSVVTGVTGDGTAQAITAAIKDVTLELTTTTPASNTMTVAYGITGSAPAMKTDTGYTTTVVYGITGFDGGSLTGTTEFVTGYTAFNGGTLTGDKTFFNGATVDGSHVLKFAKGTVGLSPATLGTASKGTVQFNAATLSLLTANVGVTGGTYSAQTIFLKMATVAATAKATVLTGVKASGNATVIKSDGLTTTAKTFVTGATLDTDGGVTLEHEVPASGAATTTYNEVSGEEIAYTPQGTIGGSQTVLAHSHTYIKLPVHSHSVNTTSTDISFQVSVPIDHSHEINIPDHTHSLNNHTHSVKLGVS